MKKALIFSGIILTMPFVVFAQENIQGVVGTIGRLLDLLLPVVVVLALLYFFYGLAKYILASDSDEGRAAARNIMIWGIIALFVIVSVWGLVRIIQTTFGLEDSPNTIPVPDVKELQNNTPSGSGSSLDDIIGT